MSAETLDQLGRKGWELCGIVKYGGLISYTFKRRAFPFPGG
jgi:hypothetical protein